MAEQRESAGMHMHMPMELPLAKKTAIVLEALLSGMSVSMTPDLDCVFDAEYNLCTEAWMAPAGIPFEEIKKDEANRTLLKVNFGGFALSDFVKLCDRMSNDQLIGIASNLVLNKLHRKDRG